jgi:hypothetical protein
MRLSPLLLFLFPLTLLAQVPQAFEFQGVARDLSGNALISQGISLRLAIVAGTSGGPLEYQETQAVTTSPLGLFTVQVGTGVPVLGTFAAIDWSAGPRFLKVEMDPAGGSTYQHMGTTQMLSVPYALVAGSIPCFTVSATGDTLYQGNGCYVIIPGLSAANPICTDADGDGYYSLAGCGTPVDCNDGNAAIHPGVAEVCDGIDNNCSGVVDEGDPGGGISCSTGQPGVCAAGATHCVGGAIICVAINSPTAEVCDGLDNNCNGATDEGNPGGGIACSTGLPGVCSSGLTQCSNGAIICVQNVMATSEVCNGLDDNCNGVVDDGAATGCNDGIACTTDACAGGTCTHTLQAGNCLIAGVCYANGTLRPGIPCQVCNTSVSTSNWSNVTSGTVCAPASCTGSSFTAASVCNGAGSCVAGAVTSCSPYTCNGAGTACLSSCSTNSQCASGFYCNGSTCVAKKADGAVCTNGAECISGNCVDGVCCNTSCNSVCKRCNLAGSVGTCTNIPAGTDPDNECTGNCNGAGACTP